MHCPPCLSFGIIEGPPKFPITVNINRGQIMVGPTSMMEIIKGTRDYSKPLDMFRLLICSRERERERESFVNVQCFGNRRNLIEPKICHSELYRDRDACFWSLVWLDAIHGGPRGYVLIGDDPHPCKKFG